MQGAPALRRITYIARLIAPEEARLRSSNMFNAKPPRRRDATCQTKTDGFISRLRCYDCLRSEIKEKKGEKRTMSEH